MRADALRQAGVRGDVANTPLLAAGIIYCYRKYSKEEIKVERKANLFIQISRLSSE